MSEIIGNLIAGAIVISVFGGILLVIMARLMKTDPKVLLKKLLSSLTGSGEEPPPQATPDYSMGGSNQVWQEKRASM